MRQLTPQQPLPDIRMTAQEWKPEPEVGIKHHDLHARAWECENGRPILDAEIDNATPPISPQNVVQTDLSAKETWNSPRTARDRFREVYPQVEELCDVTDTYPYLESHAETNLEHSEKVRQTPAVRKAIYNITRNLIAMMTTDISYCAAIVCSTERIRRGS